MSFHLKTLPNCKTFLFRPFSPGQIMKKISFMIGNFATLILLQGFHFSAECKSSLFSSLQMMQRMGWKGSGLGSEEAGITEPVRGGEVRGRNDQFKGIGVGSDPFEAFRKARSGHFYKQMKGRDKGDFKDYK